MENINYDLLVSIAVAVTGVVAAYGGLPYLIQLVKKMLRVQDGTLAQGVTLVVTAAWLAVLYVADGTLTEAHFLSGNWEWVGLLLMGVLEATQRGWEQNKAKVKAAVGG